MKLIGNIFKSMFELNLFRRRGGKFPPKTGLVQWLTGKMVYNPTTSAWEFEDKVGKSTRPIQQGKCLDPDLVDDALDFGIEMANKVFKYWNGTVVKTAATDVTGKHIMLEKMGHIFMESAGSITNYWICDSLYDGNKIRDCVGSNNISILYASVPAILTNSKDFQSFQNLHGYSVNGSELVPLRYDSSLNPTGLDVLGNTPDYTGLVKRNARAVNNNNMTFAGTEYLTLTLASGATIISQVGTSTASPSTNRIDFTAGTMDYLELSSGDIFLFASGEQGTTVYNVGNPANHATLVGANVVSVRTNTGTIPHNYLRGFSGGLYCYNSGATYKPSTQSYGTWEFNVTRPSGVLIIPFLMESNTTSGNYYSFLISATNQVRLYKVTDGAPAIILGSSAGEVATGETYRFKITRTTDGEFTLYVKSITDSKFPTDSWTLITAVSGTNPVIDNAFTSCSYSSIDLDNGQTISGFTQNAMAVDLFGYVDTTGVYSNTYIPAQNSTTDVFGNELTNPAGNYHNNAETTMLDYPQPALQKADLPQLTLYNASGVPQEMAYSDMVADVQDKHITLMDVSKPNQYKNRITYDPALSGDDLIKVLKYVNAIVRLLSADGYVLKSADGYTLYARRS